MKYKFSQFKDWSVIVCKFWAIPANTPFQRNHCFIKFHQFLADRFFVLKKWINFIKNLRKRSCRQSPAHLVSMGCVIMTPINKMKLSPKSCREPVKTKRFSIIALKKNFISRVRFSFWKTPVYIKTAFRVNETRKVSKIIKRRLDSVSDRFNILLNGIRNEVKRTFMFIHFINKFFSDNFIRAFPKGFKNPKLFTFLNKKCFDSIDNIQFFSSKHISIEWFLICNRLFIRSKRSSERIEKPIKVFNFSRVYDNHISESFSIFRENFSDVKAAISIDVTRSISKIGRFNHIPSVYGWVI